LVFIKKYFLFFKRFMPPNAYGPMLWSDPLMMISEQETDRMAHLAREKLGAFIHYFNRFGSNQSWGFYIKLGYGVDDKRGREHLWFLVHEIDEQRVSAELLNRPYHVTDLREGDLIVADVEQMSDWNVISPLGSYNPDKISLLTKLSNAIEAGFEEAAGALSEDPV
jgi:uncharacterized protein YegJ (DUF2314 family)